ncbi:membrane-associated proteins in eicosanoid and glutathione metabolism [Cystobasidium minutum MCA 4210]|uniref:membrane-associated proteins in eicosanoid and glutathione metabolism n=1 Tax=Cystobasidium minutum MCA 4210 TaxID=1397322 RepID=UPI0034D0174D|eukprot:jgi/Rhomi1/83946/CE83945_3883
MLSSTPSLASIIPGQYGLVTASCTGLGFLLAYQTVLVGQARKKAKIGYPQLYATPEQEKASKDALVFNCTQRAHQNTLEFASFALFSTLLNGILYPQFAAANMAIYLVGKVLYTEGYRTGDPSKRQRGFMASLAQITMLFASTWTSYQIYTRGI